MSGAVGDLAEMGAGTGAAPSPARARLRAPIAAAIAAVLLAGCGAPASVLTERQDPKRFEQCTDPEGAAAMEQAMQLLQEGADAAAIEPLRRVVERCPDLVRGHRYYQDTALALGGQPAAEMRRYYTALPEDAASPVRQYAKARLLESSYAKKQALDRLLRGHPEFAWGHLALARLYRSSGRLEDAIESFRRVVARYPDLYDAHLELAETLVEAGRPAEARLPYENYLRAVPNDRSSIRAFAQLLIYRLGNGKDALPWLEQLLRDDPRDEAALMDQAAARWRIGDPEGALQQYLRVLEMRPDLARAALNVGYLHYDVLAQNESDRREHWPKARAAFRLFLQLVQPDDGHEYFEELLAVPYRLKQIEDLLGPGDGQPPRLSDLR